MFIIGSSTYFVILIHDECNMYDSRKKIDSTRLTHTCDILYHFNMLK